MSVHAITRPELTPQAAAAITCWADIDGELDHLAGCYCAVASDLPRPLLAAEACTEIGAHAAPAEPPRLGFWRRLRVRHLERRLAIVIDGRERYDEAGAIGPVYRRNSLQQQHQLMARIRELKGLPPVAIPEEFLP